MSEITLIGIDLAKNIFRINCLDENGKRVMNKPLFPNYDYLAQKKRLTLHKSSRKILTPAILIVIIAPL
jgi:hypothetical protein